MQEANDAIAPAELVDKKIPWEKWNLLCESEISFLKQMGFELSPEKKGKEKKVKFTCSDIAHAVAPKPHLHRTIITCDFCKVKDVFYFDMRKKGNSLYGERISEERYADLRYNGKMEASVASNRAVTCEHCLEMLGKKDKKELITLVLMQQIKIKTGRAVAK
jgi:hypothetical protein